MNHMEDTCSFIDFTNSFDNFLRESSDYCKLDALKEKSFYNMLFKTYSTKWKGYKIKV